EVLRYDLLRPQQWHAAGFAVLPTTPIELSPECIGVAGELRLSVQGRQLRRRVDVSGQLQVVQGRGTVAG
ncbi:hypothetical protein AAGG41_23615, partial [Stenotrophomonas maltophilia]